MIHPTDLTAVVLTTLSEPFLNMAETLAAKISDAGIAASAIATETFFLNPAHTPAAVYVASNEPRAWALASALTRAGAYLGNGHPAVCGMDRLDWKTALSRAKIETPLWMYSESPAILMANWSPTDFPAFLKQAGSGRSHARLFRSLGDLSEHFQTSPVPTGPFLLEKSLGLDSPRKMYVINDGAQAFTLRGAIRSEASQPERDLAQDLQAITKLSNFSFDLLPISGSSTQSSVIDINRFPVYANSDDCWSDVAKAFASDFMKVGHLDLIAGHKIINGVIPTKEKKHPQH